MTQHQAPEVTSVVVPLSIWNAVVNAAQAYADFAAAREAMNAARPAISATRAEYALYDERYKADHKAERKHWTTAIELAQVAEQIVAASTDDNDTRATQPLSLTETAAALVAKLDECDPHLTSMFSFALAHDHLYSGPQYSEALEALRAALGEQIAENANCSGDIDRSGLAQEVES